MFPRKASSAADARKVLKLLIRTSGANPGWRVAGDVPRWYVAPSAYVSSVLRVMTFCCPRQLSIKSSAVRHSVASDPKAASEARLLFPRLRFCAFCTRRLVFSRKLLNQRV